MSGKRLSLNEIRVRIAKFAVDYENVTAEKQHSSDFWKALMRCYGVEDSFLQGVTFEYPARRSDTGGTGFIDVFLPGHYLIEQKTDGKIVRPKGAAESNAEQQARAYLTGGDITDKQMPRWVVTSDFKFIQVTDLTEPRKSVARTVTVRTADLAEHVETFLFLTGDDVGAIIAQDQAEASVKAARLMGDLYAAMTDDADTSGAAVVSEEAEDAATHRVSILMTRLLFLMFGDDAGLWRRDLFQEFIETRTAADGSDLGQQLSALFGVLDTPGVRPKRMDAALRDFPYVNGAIFSQADTTLVWFDTAMRDALLAACRFDWSRISPAVFGSLFQTVKSRAARHGDGEHYTSERNILKTLRPMFLDDLRARLVAADSKPKLEALHESMRHFRYVDPACGCGNFIIVAYREMRALELDLLVKLRTMQGAEDKWTLDPSSVLHVRLDQFFGIEINWWPAKIAETAMFLVDHQANQRMEKKLGFTPIRLPINISANIRHCNALTTDWDTILPAAGPTMFVFGNPPFQGRKGRTGEQSTELAAAWGLPTAGHLDLVTAWYATAAHYLADKVGEFAFVATNSITQGEPVVKMFEPLTARGWSIKFAHRPFAWTSETSSKERAAVHVVIVGFVRGATFTGKRTLFFYRSPTAADGVARDTRDRINGYLVVGSETYARKRLTTLSPELPRVGSGSMPNDGGGLLVEAGDYDQVTADPVAAKYVRRIVGTDELVKNIPRWCLWLVDLDPGDVAQSPVLKARLRRVRDTRLDSRNPDTVAQAETPHKFWFIAQPTVPYLCVPSVVSENRPYFTAARFGPDVITSNLANVCDDPDGFAFGVISSKMFLTWQETVGGRLESRLRFSNTVVWNNLPLPTVPPTLRKQIIVAGQNVLVARNLHPERSLAQHYPEFGMDGALFAAHQGLDRLVDRAFGCTKRKPTTADRQTSLFQRFAEMVPS